ncbi:winged helix-turn-helix transcriptional regulator [Adlercreutzia sp. R25]|uniref:Winged helix-turn-helix transcriptional regulator n=1 Tax=Adlercreutzia shanghongiae TaxID=3111773 RepID=A0ABU6IXW3_9ACTN|nr:MULTISPECIES: winged helix-turn-helix transcriptional regulator [unclassified Adlercreutzia]MEC4272490.1 winged helix-turn-helix transcriptional regulator [Adlercreutzia sp. R25]MEC4294610.1 winged helix-turn-helix transcriptional regulator [Adlercreutzia sp. R22]
MRASYTNIDAGVFETTRYLEQFFENAIVGTNHELKNRFLHVEYGKVAGSVAHGPSDDISKCNSKDQICTFDCTLGELAVLKLLAVKPSTTQKEVASKLGVSERTVKTRTVKLQEKGLLERVNGKRNGRWIVSEKSASRGDRLLGMSR